MEYLKLYFLTPFTSILVGRETNNENVEEINRNWKWIRTRIPKGSYLGTNKGNGKMGRGGGKTKYFLNLEKSPSKNKWAKVCSPHYHWLLQTLAIICWTNIGPMCVVRTIIGCLHALAIICWTNINIESMCVIRTIIGCLNTLAVICWTNIWSIRDQHFGNVYSQHNHNLLKYASQIACLH